MAKRRYIEKSTGELWTCGGFSTDENHIRLYRMYKYDEPDSEIEMTEEERDERFEYKPWPAPIRDLEQVKPRHPIHIVLRCPECGSPLKVEGGAYLTSPLQYEHKCSNKDCKYEVCTCSIYSGMYAAVTDYQEEKIKDGTFREHFDGEIFELKEEDLWDFKKESE